MDLRLLSAEPSDAEREAIDTVVGRAGADDGRVPVITEREIEQLRPIEHRSLGDREDREERPAVRDMPAIGPTIDDVRADRKTAVVVGGIDGVMTHIPVSLFLDQSPIASHLEPG